MTENGNAVLTPETEVASNDANFLTSIGIAPTTFEDPAITPGATQPANTSPPDPTKPKLKVAWGSAQNGNTVISEKTTEKVREALDAGRIDEYTAAKALQNPQVLSGTPDVTAAELNKLQDIAAKEDKADGIFMLRPVTMTKDDLVALFNIGGELDFVRRDRQVSDPTQATGKSTTPDSAGFTQDDKTWLQSVGINPEETADPRKPKSKDDDVNKLLPFGEQEAGNNNMTLQERQEVNRLKGSLSSDDLAFAIEKDTRDMDKLAAGKESMPIGETLREEVAERRDARQERKESAAAPASLPGFSGIVMEDVDSISPVGSTPAAAQMEAQRIKDQRNAAWVAANPDKVKKKDQ